MKSPQQSPVCCGFFFRFSAQPPSECAAGEGGEVSDRAMLPPRFVWQNIREGEAMLPLFRNRVSAVLGKDGGGWVGEEQGIG